ELGSTGPASDVIVANTSASAGSIAPRSIDGSTASAATSTEYTERVSSGRRSNNESTGASVAVAGSESTGVSAGSAAVASSVAVSGVVASGSSDDPEHPATSTAATPTAAT